ncbi:MAG: pilus assembly protein PilM [Candidatus Competibacteraceae bacterium]|nr:pilus assembly protein PilM [Candidatus Competibacteraceae bacterium]
MASLLPSRKKRLILDIGSSAIRVCELARTKNGYQLTKYYQQEYSSDPGLDELGVRAARAKALEEVLKRSKIRHRKTVFAVPGQSVFTRHPRLAARPRVQGQSNRQVRNSAADPLLAGSDCDGLPGPQPH